MGFERTDDCGALVAARATAATERVADAGYVEEESCIAALLLQCAHRGG